MTRNVFNGIFPKVNLTTKAHMEDISTSGIRDAMELTVPVIKTR